MIRSCAPVLYKRCNISLAKAPLIPKRLVLPINYRRTFHASLTCTMSDKKEEKKQTITAYEVRMFPYCIKYS